jgi:hypothetical protein
VSNLLKFRLLAWREKQLFCEAGVLSLLSILCLKVVAFRRIYRFLCNHYGDVKTCTGEPDRYASDVKLIERSISRASNRLPWTPLCLSRSIAQFIMLRRRAIPAVLFAGAKCSVDSLLDAHAWVESGLEANDNNTENSGFATVIRIGTRAVAR